MAYDVPDSFVGFRRTLDQEIQPGMSDEAATKKIVSFADNMAGGVDPENREERLLKEIWSISTPDEKDAIASVLLKVARAGAQVN